MGIRAWWAAMHGVTRELDTTKRLNNNMDIDIDIRYRHNSRLRMQETQVRSLGQEDPLEKEMATHSSTLAWKIPWMEEPGRLQSMGSQRLGHQWVMTRHNNRLRVDIDVTVGWRKHKLESRLLGEISITSDMQMTPPLWQKVKRN